MVGLIFFGGSMAEPDLLLIIQPGLVMRAKTCIQNPLHESLLHLGLVFVVGFAVRPEEPLCQVRLRGNYGAPGIHLLLRIFAKDPAMVLEYSGVLFAPSGSRLKLTQFFQGN